jgi:hypothetical protein
MNKKSLYLIPILYYCKLAGTDIKEHGCCPASSHVLYQLLSVVTTSCGV